MPRFSKSLVPTVGIRRNWYDSTRTIFQDCSSGICKIVLDDGTPILDQPANTVTACECSAFAIWGVPKEGGGPRVYDSRERIWDGADIQPDSMGPDGALALKLERNSYGPWDVVEADGSRWRLTDGDANSIQLLGNQRALWLEGTTLHFTSNIAFPFVPKSCWWPRALQIENRWHLLYQDVVTAALAIDDRLIMPAGNYFRPDIRQHMDGSIHIVWSSNEGETDVIPYVISSEAAIQQLPLLSQQVVVPKIGRKLWVAFFCHDMTASSGLPANAVLDVDRTSFTSGLLLEDSGLRPVAVYTAAETGAVTPEQAIAVARKQHPGLDVMFYWTRSHWGTPLPSADIIAVEAYHHADESDLGFYHDVKTELLRAPRAAIVAQCYSEHPEFTRDLASLVPMYAQLAIDCPNVEMILAFSGSNTPGKGRATGYQDHPEVHEPYQQLMAGVTGAPAIHIHISPPPPPPPPPPLPVKRMFPHIDDSEVIDLAHQFLASYQRGHSQEDTLRDAAYYGKAYYQMRGAGNSHAGAVAEVVRTAATDDYINMALVAGTSVPDIGDDNLTAYSAAFNDAYTAIGRFQKQSLEENVRDDIYWLKIYILWRIEHSNNHENALRAVRGGIFAEAGQKDPTASVVVNPHPLTATGERFFRVDGTPFRWKQVSAFSLLDRWAKGQDVSQFVRYWLDRGWNGFRVWPYVPVKDWGTSAWDDPGLGAQVDFLQYMQSEGARVEMTLLTDDDPARIAPARATIDRLARERFPHLTFEAGNEPLTHKNIDVEALRSALQASGYLYSSGVYEDANRAWGSYVTFHPGGPDEWARRAKDAREWYDGGGPNAPSDPPHKVPAIANEMTRPDKAPGDLSQKTQDYRAFGACCALHGGGGTFHYQGGKLFALPNGEEEACADAMLAGLTAFPDDAPAGGYHRLERVDDPTTIRTYAIGSYMVRVPMHNPQMSPTMPAGWTALDVWGILGRR